MYEGRWNDKDHALHFLGKDPFLFIFSFLFFFPRVAIVPSLWHNPLKERKAFLDVSGEPMDVTHPEGYSCQLWACAKAGMSQNQAGGASLNVSESV